MDIPTISVFIIIIGCVIGLAEWIRVVKNDAGTMAAQIHTLETTIEHLEEEINECKHDKKFIETFMQEISEKQIVNDKIIFLLQEKLNN